MKPKGWSVLTPNVGDFWEEDVIATAKPVHPTVVDRGEREVLLVRPNGEPLLVRESRPVGFRKP